MVAELVHSGVPLADVARLDDRQTKWLYFRARNEHGELEREEYDDDGPRVTHPVSYESMWKQVKKNRGLTDDEAERAWKLHLEREPSLRKFIARLGPSKEEFEADRQAGEANLETVEQN